MGYTPAMDPVTHIVSGALAGRLARDGMGTRAAYGLCVLAAWLPDIDNFVGLGPEAYLRHHRGITHSLLGIVVQAVLLAAAFRLFGRAFTPLKTFALALALLAGHLWLDVITSFGTQLLAPFSDARLAWGGVFIIDPVMTLGALALLVLSLRRSARGAAGRRLAAAGLALLVAYPLACHGVRAVVTAATARALAPHGWDRSFDISPDALSPFFWKLTVRDGERLLVGHVTALTAPGDPLELESHTAADPLLLERLGQRSSMFATWAWFARFPVVQAQELPGAQDGRTRLRFLDARFLPTSPVLRPLAGRRETPFAITAVLAPDGALERVLYAGHSHPLRPPGS